MRGAKGAEDGHFQYFFLEIWEVSPNCFRYR
jgi:hypothetical protein